MDGKLFDKLFYAQGLYLGLVTAIPFKFGISLDPTNYVISLLKMFLDRSLRDSNSAFNVSGFLYICIIGITVLATLLFILSLYGVYLKVKENANNFFISLIGFLIGIVIIFNPVQGVLILALFIFILNVLCKNKLKFE